MKKKCPCCNAPQTFFSFKGQRIILPCDNKVNYKCLHCAVCHNQIGKPIHAVLYHLLIIGLLFASWWIASMIRQVFHLWDHYKGIFFDAPIMFIVYLIISYLVWYVTPLNCTKIRSVNKLDDTDPMHIEENPLLTSIEQKIVKQGIKFTIFIQVFLLLTIALGIIYILIRK